MKRFYLLLGGLAVAGAAILYVVSGQKAMPGTLTPGAPVPATGDGFAGYTLGSDSAPVEVVEYSDFECPFCARFANLQMPAIRRQLIETGLVRWRYRDYPIPNHQYARYAAHAAQCAGEQGRYWEMHDALFADHSWAQTGKNPARLFNSMAQRVVPDFDRFEACQASNRYAGRIEAAYQEGVARGVGGTPTFFVNGRLADYPRGPTSDDFKALAESLAARR